MPAEHCRVGEVSRRAISGWRGVRGLGEEGRMGGMVWVGVGRGWVRPMQDRVRGVVVTLTVVLHMMGVEGGEGAMRGRTWGGRQLGVVLV